MPPGARQSIAGDEFYVLWAINRALRMLDPKSRLRRIVMEDVSPLDEVFRNPAILLAVDLTEYFCGDDFTTAEEMIVSQLKYSHRTSRIVDSCAALRKGVRGNPSVIKRLAQVYEAHRRTHGRDLVVTKLRLRLVSNQPAAARLASVLAKTGSMLATRPGQVRLRTLSSGLNTSELADLTRLKGASGLSELAFSDLIRLFDIEDLGTGSRAAQEQQMVAALGRHVLTDSGSMNGLYRRFHREPPPRGCRVPWRHPGRPPR